MVLTGALEGSEICRHPHKEITIPQRVGLSWRRTTVVILKWRTQVLRMRLTRHDIAPEGTFAEWHNNGSLTEVDSLTDDALYYTGQVVGQAHSYVALTYETNTLSGIIQTGHELIVVEPYKHQEGRGSGLGYHLLSSCGRTKPPPPDTFHRQRRNRRATTDSYTKFLEVLIVADTSVVSYVGQARIKSYIMTLMNIVNTVYHDPSLDTNIEVVTVKIMYMDEQSGRTVVRANDPQRTVDNFCQWVSSQTYRSARSGPGANHDVAVLLTRKEFATAGFAPITGMCLPMRNCALVKDEGFTGAFVVAHEMAHIFGLMHDGHGNTCYGQHYRTSIMATIVQSSFNHYWWSECSRRKMKEVIGSLYCLDNNPYMRVTEDLRLPLGLGWSLDDQCRLEFGGVYCRAFRSIDPCSQLWCTDTERRYSCKTKNGVPLDGTMCGASEHWYCQAGRCGYHGDHYPIHGGWSQWTTWSECSSPCGIGFKRRSRNCDSPEPQYEGNDCDGESDNSDTCFSQECTEYSDQRSSRCNMMDIVPIRGRTYTWDPYQANNVKDRCKLTCISEKKEVVTFDSLVDNGTPCSYGVENYVCLNGECVKVGCDGVRGSDTTIDRCGVCNGDGTSCKLVSGVYEKKFDYSAAGGKEYTRVLVLPKGSRNITLKELATLPHFLSLQDTVYYNHKINGERRQGYSENFVMEGAWFKYTNHRGHETLRTDGPLHRDVNVLVSYHGYSQFSFAFVIGVQHLIYGCYDNDNNSKVDDEKCEYAGSKEIEDVECTMIDCSSLMYLWRMLTNFSECSTSCGTEGLRHRMYECERLSDFERVDPEYCSFTPEPIFEEPCNRFDCETKSFRWKVTSEWSSCSASCGNSGSQYQLFYCVEEHDDELKVDEKFCADLISPKEPRPCNRNPCVVYKWKLSDSWQQCNESCGDYGIQSKKSMCMEVRGESEKPTGIWYCNGKSKPTESRACNRRECFVYEWVTSPWSDCSQTCNEGLKIREVLCKNITFDDRERTVPDTYCDTIEKPSIEANCEMEKCTSYGWKSTGNWTECSVTCGSNGIQQEILKCYSDGTGEQVDKNLCDNFENTPTERECSSGPCFRFEWKNVTDSWSPVCQQTCEDKYVDHQELSVQCYQVYANGVEELAEQYLCDMEERPMITRKCERVDCQSYKWDVSDWDGCDAGCGDKGEQRGVIVCLKYNDEGSQRVNDEKCVADDRPSSSTRACTNDPCFRLIDDAKWGECSTTCGQGIQVKNQSCVMKDSDHEEVVDITLCEVNITQSTRSCDMGPCGYLEWGAGNWSMCSKSCGQGKQKRIIFCGDPTQPSDFSMCPGKSPNEFKICNNGPCSDDRRPCVKDRAPFCVHASIRLCMNPAYRRVCCTTCSEIQSDRAGSPGWYRRRLRRMQRIRRYLHRLRARQ
ncbi:A disintegrin and metalloproteinase with thrombospondin motifs 14 [Mactra antiquata]